MLHIDISSLNALLNEVIVHFDMLRVCMEHWVPSQMNIAHVSVVEGNQFFMGTHRSFNMLFNQTTSHVATSPPYIQLLCSTMQLSAAFCYSMRDSSAAEAEDKSRGRSSDGLVADPICTCVLFESNDCVRLIQDVIIHRPTNVPEYSLSAIQMNILMFLHELAK